MKMDKLPDEILLHHIFPYVYDNFGSLNRDCLNTMICCKRWARLMMPLMWFEVVVRPGNVGAFVNAITARTFDYGYHIKYLLLDEDMYVDRSVARDSPETNYKEF